MSFTSYHNREKISTPVSFERRLRCLSALFLGKNTNKRGKVRLH